MAHYDLYKSLGLNPNEPSEQLRGRIEGMLAAGAFANPGGKAELEIAREVLGTPRKRQMYDAKLANPQADPVTVQDLRLLASMNVDGGSAPTQVPEPPQYQQVPQQYFQSVAQPQQPQQPQNKGVAGKIAVVTVVALLILTGIGAAAYYFVVAPGWKGDHAQLADEYPGIVSSREGGEGWDGLTCEAGDPDADQTAKITCGGQQLTVSAVKFASADSREQFLPTEDSVTLDNGQCAVESAQFSDNGKPTFAVWSEDRPDSALLISGDYAESARLQMPLCK